MARRWCVPGVISYDDAGPSSIHTLVRGWFSGDLCGKGTTAAGTATRCGSWVLSAAPAVIAPRTCHHRSEKDQPRKPTPASQSPS